MPSRVQQLILGLGVGKQADIATAGTTFHRFRKIDTAVTTPKPVFEDDAPEIGKGHEFATQTYPSHYEVANRLEKYASAEFLLWAIGFGLGNVVVTSGGGAGGSTTGSTTSGSTAVTVTSATGIAAGATVSGTGIATGTTVAAITGTSVTLSLVATATGASVSLTFGAVSAFSYTVLPIDPGTTLELPYFSVAEQIAEGGGSAIDNLFVGCAIEDWTYSFNYGPGRASSKMMVNWLGSGLLTSPSAVSVPALTPENSILAAGMSLTWNGIDYVSSKRILSGSIGWKNNLMEKAGFFPGSGLQNGLQVRGRLEIGARVPTFQFTTRLLHTSTEYANLVSQATAPAVLTIPRDSNNTVTFTFPKMALEMVENTEADGIVAVTVTGKPEFDTVTGTVLSVTGNCNLGGIAQ
jgi:hypothetical protein